MDGFKEIKHKQDQRLRKCIHAQEALAQCIGTNRLVSLGLSTLILIPPPSPVYRETFRERNPSYCSLGTTVYILSLYLCCRSTAMMTGAGACCPGQSWQQIKGPDYI